METLKFGKHYLEVCHQGLGALFEDANDYGKVDYEKLFGEHMAFFVWDNKPIVADILVGDFPHSVKEMKSQGYVLPFIPDYEEHTLTLEAYY